MPITTKHFSELPTPARESQTKMRMRAVSYASHEAMEAADHLLKTLEKRATDPPPPSDEEATTDA